MKRASLLSLNRVFVLAVALATVSCNTTPNERKEIANREIEQIDERVENLASKTKAEAKEAKAALARRKAEAEQRRARGPVAGKQQQMDQELLGEYRYLSQVSADSLKDAYVHFLQQVRDRKDVWTMEDWDYANGIYQRLNEREEILHGDIVLRHAAKIKALQAEYLALENRADLQDYQRIKKEQVN